MTAMLIFKEISGPTQMGHHLEYYDVLKEENYTNLDFTGQNPTSSKLVQGHSQHINLSRGERMNAMASMSEATVLNIASIIMDFTSKLHLNIVAQ